MVTRVSTLFKVGRGKSRTHSTHTAHRTTTTGTTGTTTGIGNSCKPTSHLLLAFARVPPRFPLALACFAPVARHVVFPIASSRALVTHMACCHPTKKCYPAQNPTTGSARNPLAQVVCNGMFVLWLSSSILRLPCCIPPTPHLTALGHVPIPPVYLHGVTDHRWLPREVRSKHPSWPPLEDKGSAIIKLPTCTRHPSCIPLTFRPPPPLSGLCQYAHHETLEKSTASVVGKPWHPNLKAAIANQTCRVPFPSTVEAL
ncbi:hypothetical protein DM02DRAFT_439626 [Periconia macrospinosa]|uniref:Uncharacterized protein n=1 Tax=Periconia macrospinosa TaxID=97972 RepID=A0A2V1DPH2_9PLEO|nr:hypothetical protein DM02DRAFT_439626 [Periconia macrospinosa]